jgi:DNA-binding GntR family transcriptional regulator
MSAAMGEDGGFAAPRVGKLADVVYDALKAQIHDFQLVAGDRFSEAELAQRLGVSRTPVREALFRLRDEGFLGVESKLGWYVLPIDFGRLEQLYDLRVVLELASIARLCARADAPAGLEALKAIWLVPPAERLADPRRVGLHDEQFHAALVRAAGNDEMARVHWDVTERIRIIRRLDFTRADRIEATYIERVEHLSPVLLERHEARALEDLQVLHDGLPRHVRVGGERGGRTRAGTEPGHDRESGFVTKRGEDPRVCEVSLPRHAS